MVDFILEIFQTKPNTPKLSHYCRKNPLTIRSANFFYNSVDLALYDKTGDFLIQWETLEKKNFVDKKTDEQSKTQQHSNENSEQTQQQQQPSHPPTATHATQQQV